MGEHRLDRTPAEVTQPHRIATNLRSNRGVSLRREDDTNSARSCCDRVLKRRTARRSVAAMVIDLRQHLGRVGERLAHEHLERLGYSVVARNYRTRFGELDLIVCDDDALVFVEVKTRRAGAMESALQAVSAIKQKRVRAMAAAWLVEAVDRPRSRELRFDVIAVTVDRGGRLVLLEHLEGAF
jgi:putative endonuclease